MHATEKNSSLIRAARRLRLAVVAAVPACLAVSLLAVWPAAALGPLAASFDAGGLPRGWAVAIALALAGLIVAALVELVRMLGRIERGEVFSPATTRHFRRFAMLLLAAAVLRLLAPMAVESALAAAGQRAALSLFASGGDVLALLVAVVVFFVARLFDEAARLEEDSRSIV